MYPLKIFRTTILLLSILFTGSAVMAQSAAHLSIQDDPKTRYLHGYPQGPFLVYKTHKEGFSTRYLYGYMNADSKLVIDYQFTGADRFKNGFAMVWKGNRAGIIDTAGRTVAPCIYTSIETWLNGKRWTANLLNDSLAIIDSTGKIIYQGPGKSVRYNEDINRMSVEILKYQDTPRTILLDYDGHLIASYTSRFGGRTSFNPIEQHFANPTPVNKKALFLSDNRLGAVTDMQGKILIDSVMAGAGFYDGTMVLGGPTKVALIDTGFNEIIPFSDGYTALSKMTGMPRYCVRKNGLWGIIDSNRNIIIKPSLPAPVSVYNSSGFLVHDIEKNKDVYYNYKGEQIKDYEFLATTTPLRQRFPVPAKIDDHSYRLWKGSFIGAPHRLILEFDQDGHALYEDEHTKGLLDTNGKEILHLPYFYCSMPTHGFMCAGDTMTITSRDAHPCSHVFMGVGWAYTSRYFIIDMHGKRINNEYYDRISPFLWGYAQVSKDCNDYLIDTHGRRADTAQPIQISGWKANLCIVMNRKAQQALMNKTGKIVSPWVTSFHTAEDSMHVYSMLPRNSDGGSVRTVLPDFKNSVIIFKKDQSLGIMDSTGKIIAEPIYTRMTDQWGYYLVVTGDRDHELQGALTPTGKVILPAEYNLVQSIGIPTNRYFMLRKTTDSDWTIFHYTTE